MVGVVQDLRTRHDGEPLVEKTHEAAHEPGLGLASFAEENDVVTCQKRVFQCGQDGTVVADQPFHDGLAGGDTTSNIVPDLVLHGTRTPA